MKHEKSEKMYDAITDIRDDLVESAEKKKPRRRRWWPAAVAAVLAVAIAGGVILWPDGSPAAGPGSSENSSGNESSSPGAGTGSPLAAAARTLAAAQYPQMAPYPNEMDYIDPATREFDSAGFSQVYDAWRTDRRAQLDQPEGYADGLDAFFAASIGQFLSGTEGENRVYSPLNVYMALAMLAELTGGNSREQILDLLGSGSIEALREQASALWNANYCDDGATTSVLASSVWLNENVNFVQETMDTLAEIYYASSYQGTMGSAEFNQALRDWLNEQTGGLLEEQAGQIEMDPDTILALATTVYFRAKWADEFSESRTEPGVFHAADGDVTCDFMHQSGGRTYYWGDRFSAVVQSLEGSGGMWFILPDEGVGVDELLQDGQVMEFLLTSESKWENSRSLTVNLAVPKFDVTSQLELKDGLKALGVTDVFDGSVSDFSPMTGDTDEIFVSKVQHDARVTIDEEGCTAAAYTVMAMLGGSAPPEEEIDFVVDRPFLFAITGADGLPLFVGVVNHAN